MIQVTNIQDLKTAVNQNGEMVITMNNNDIVIMKMEEYREKLEKYKSLKGTCDEQIIIQTIEMQFNNNNESSKGLLYFLLCVLVIMLIFAML